MGRESTDVQPTEVNSLIEEYNAARLPQRDEQLTPT